MAKGVGLRLLSRRGSWVQIPPSAPQIQAYYEVSLVNRAEFMAIRNVAGLRLKLKCEFTGKNHVVRVFSSRR